MKAKTMAHQLDAEAVDSRSFDMDDAAAAIGDLINDDEELEESDEEEVFDPELDEGEEPDAEDGDEDADEDDEPETAIEAPASMTAEEKEAFSQLPEEAQQLTRDFALRRDKDIQNGLERERAAQQQSKIEAAATLAEARKANAEQLAQFVQTFAPQPPSAALAQQNPQAYIAQKAQYDEEVAQYQNMVQPIIQQFQQGEQEEAQAQQAFIAQRDKELSQIPEMQDPAKRDAYVQKAFGLAESLGFERDTVIADFSAGDIKLLHEAAGWKEKADKWDASMSKRMKSVRHGKTAKAKAAQPVGSAKRQAKAKSRTRLRQTGSVEDAAAAIASLR